MPMRYAAFANLIYGQTAYGRWLRSTREMDSQSLPRVVRFLAKRVPGEDWESTSSTWSSCGKLLMAWKKGILAIRMRTRQPKPRGQISDWGPMIAMGRGLRWRCAVWGCTNIQLLDFFRSACQGRKGIHVIHVILIRKTLYGYWSET